MLQANRDQAAPVAMAEAGTRSLYRIAGVAALLQLACVLGIIVVSGILGPRPKTAEEYFVLQQQDRPAAILRADPFSPLMVTLYLGTFPALYAALRRVSPAYTALASLFTFIAVTICAATQSAFSMVHLADQYAAATSDVMRARLLAAGDAVIASDMWHSTGAFLSGILLQGAGVIISAIMLRNRAFGKATAYSGLVANGFDLAQHILNPFLPSLAGPFMMLAGPAYLVWFPLLARDFFRLAHLAPRTIGHPAQAPELLQES